MDPRRESRSSRDYFGQIRGQRVALYEAFTKARAAARANSQTWLKFGLAAHALDNGTHEDTLPLSIQHPTFSIQPLNIVVCAAKTFATQRNGGNGGFGGHNVWSRFLHHPKFLQGPKSPRFPPLPPFLLRFEGFRLPIFVSSGLNVEC